MQRVSSILLGSVKQHHLPTAGRTSTSKTSVCLALPILDQEDMPSSAGLCATACSLTALYGFLL